MGTPSPLGVAVRRLREKTGLSVRALAKRADVPFTTISGLENGQQWSLALPALTRLSVALGDRRSKLFSVAASMPTRRADAA